MPNQKGASNGGDLPVKPAELVVGAAGKLSPADALKLFVGIAREAVQLHETEITKRERLHTYRDTEVARIKASEKALRDYFDQVFAERRETHKRLFEGLDRALESGDVAAVQTVVGGIVEVARTSPLADIGNLGELRRAMGDPNTVFEL